MQGQIKMREVMSLKKKRTEERERNEKSGFEEGSKGKG